MTIGNARRKTALADLHVAVDWVWRMEGVWRSGCVEGFRVGSSFGSSRSTFRDL
jgi:hypothetical protein